MSEFEKSLLLGLGLSALTATKTADVVTTVRHVDARGEQNPLVRRLVPGSDSMGPFSSPWQSGSLWSPLPICRRCSRSTESIATPSRS